MALAKSSGLNLLCRGPGAYLIRFIRESHEGTVPHASPQKGSPGVDQYTEKVEAKGRKELEQLTEQSHPPDDDWVDVWTSCILCGPSAHQLHSVPRDVRTALTKHSYM